MVYTNEIINGGVLMKELFEKRIIALLNTSCSSGTLKELVECWEKVSEQERFDKESFYSWDIYEDLKKRVVALEGRFEQEGV